MAVGIFKMSCPVCGEGGEYFQATPKAEASHFAARAIWAIHRMRQALEAMGKFDRSRLASALVREIEELREETKPPHDA